MDAASWERLPENRLGLAMVLGYASDGGWNYRELLLKVLFSKEYCVASDNEFDNEIVIFGRVFCL